MCLAANPLTHGPQCHALMNRKWSACAVCGSQAAAPLTPNYPCTVCGRVERWSDNGIWPMSQMLATHGENGMKQAKKLWLPNYMRKLRYLQRIGAIPIGAGLHLVDVAHDDWCGMF